MTVTNIVTTIVESATSLLGGIGAGIVEYFETLFLNSEGGISNLGIYLLCFVGFGVAIGCMRWIRTKIG